MPTRPTVRDLLVAGAFAAWAVIEVFVGTVSGSWSIDLSTALVATVPLAWRRSAPALSGLACTAGVFVKTGLAVNIDGMAMLTAVFFASYSVGRNLPTRRAVAVIGVMVALVWSVMWRVPDTGFYTWVFAAIWIGGPGFAGAVFRAQLERAARLAARVARAEAQREEHARAAVRAERDRIAREMHDTVAHAVSVMVLQTGAVRSRLPEELTSERTALDQSAQSGRQAITDLHRLLGLLRSDDEVARVEPQPTLGQLDTLVEESRRLGLDVDLQVEGDWLTLDPSVEVSAYRIVQEALTNVRKHARASSAQILLRFADGQLHITVTDDGTDAPDSGSEGFGLLGIRERVEVYGGQLSAHRNGHGFVLDASLPTVAP